MRSRQPGPETDGDKGSEDKSLTMGKAIGRMGTATNLGYMGRGLMKALAHFQMHHARANGFTRIDLGTMSHAVLHVWSNPPAPWKAEVLSRITLEELDKDEYAETLEFFAKCTKWVKADVRVTL
jgi:hypothetical protein